MFKGEKTFESERTVKYFYEKSYQKTNNLIIIFSAMPAKGKMPGYNFVSTLKEFDCNKLFILDDFGCRGSYYLCENKDFSIERSVISLINFIIKENKIDKVITCGSSKGGYAALYYGIKYGFSNIIAGSPQYLLGEYLINQAKEGAIAKFMSGAIEKEDYEFLNRIMSDMISNSPNKPRVFIHLGKGEANYHKHVKPLMKKLEEKQIDYQLDLGDYSKHIDVAKFFPPILKEKVRETLGYPLLRLEKSLEGRHPLNKKYEFKAKTDSTSKLAWYVYYNGEKINSSKYSFDRSFTLSFDKKGKYQVKVFAINEKDFKVSIKSNIIEIV
ncbi:Two component regulator three Y domain-containing protein [Lederbergia citrea]|uniref:Two component regulator three Y domain-containing protein n=1 Tax=Lederbergia citrea TaxID=2833581 RepID=UPI001BC9E1DC|nr:Two component regulator three Y domain-containing protein [Lederbergia citrea]MBS4204792.1 Two component regulator three Y domain-containing protein [Lederbergia citrea]